LRALTSGDNDNDHIACMLGKRLDRFKKHIQSQYDMVDLRDLKRAILRTKYGNSDLSKKSC
jgi:hypothetical protein